MNSNTPLHHDSFSTVAAPMGADTKSIANRLVAWTSLAVIILCLVTPVLLWMPSISVSSSGTAHSRAIAAQAVTERPASPMAEG